MLRVPSSTYVVAGARGARFAAARAGELASLTQPSRPDSMTPGSGSSPVPCATAPRPGSRSGFASIGPMWLTEGKEKAGECVSHRNL
jgi:hypothetical protein